MLIIRASAVDPQPTLGILKFLNQIEKRIITGLTMRAGAMDTCHYRRYEIRDANI